MTTDQSLQRLFSKRAWYKNTGINGSTARIYKKRFIEDKLELETKIRILKTVGYEMVQDIKWEAKADPVQIKTGLIKKLKKANAFWHVEPVSESFVPDETLIQKVLEYLDIDDIRLLFLIFSSKEIKRIWREKMVRQEPFFHNLNRLYAVLFFNIRHPDRYISNQLNKNLKTIHAGTD